MNSNPSLFQQLPFTDDDFKVHAWIIGDRQPNVLLHELLNTAFNIAKHGNTTLILANSDVQLQTHGWATAVQRGASPTPSYDTAVHTRPPKAGEHDWRPRTFWIPRAWWDDTKQFIPPLFFPAPWWEDALRHYIPFTDPQSRMSPSCTAHEPHPMAVIPDHQRPPSVKFNQAIDTGWRDHHYQEPREVRRLRHKHQANEREQRPSHAPELHIRNQLDKP